MPKQRHTTQSKSTKSTKKSNRSRNEAKTASKQPKQGGTPALGGMARNGSMDTQAAWLTDPRLAPAQRQAVALEMGQVQGNQHVQRMLANTQPGEADAAYQTERTVQRLLFDDRSDQQIIQDAIKNKDISDAMAVDNYSLATPQERLELIDIIMNSYSAWYGYSAKVSKMYQIWGSFGAELEQLLAQPKFFKVWKKSYEAGVPVDELPLVQRLQGYFAEDVELLAKKYLVENELYVREEFERLGIDGLVGPRTQDQSKEMEETQNMMVYVADALKAQKALRQVPVGYDTVGVSNWGPGRTEVARFDPKRKPMHTADPYGRLEVETAAWDDIKKSHDDLQALINQVADKYPAIHAMLREDNVDKLGETAETAPDTARATISKALEGLMGNIQSTYDKIGGDIEYYDLKPLHAQLLSGMPSPQGFQWNQPFLKWTAQEALDDEESREFWIALGLGSLAAAAFIFSTIATGGTAAVLFAAGLGAGGLQAGMSWEKYLDLAEAAETNVKSDTAIVSEGQVDAALMSAILDTAFALLDVYAPAKAGVKAGYRALRGGVEIAGELAEAGLAAGGRALDGLESLRAAGALEPVSGGAVSLAERQMVIEQAISEVGVEETVRRSGKSAEELLLLVEPNSSAGQQLGEFVGGTSAATAAVESGAHGARQKTLPGPWSAVDEEATDAAGRAATDFGEETTEIGGGLWDEADEVTQVMDRETLADLVKKSQDESLDFGREPKRAAKETPEALTKEWAEKGVEHGLFTTAADLTEFCQKVFKRPIEPFEHVYFHTDWEAFGNALRRNHPDADPLDYGAFYDPATGFIHFGPAAQESVTVLHEAVHMIIDGMAPGMRREIGSFLDEGITEWIARIHMGPRAERMAYEPNVEFVEELAEILGQETVENVLIHGNLDKLWQGVMRALDNDIDRAAEFFATLRNIAENGPVTDFEALRRAQGMLDEMAGMSRNRAVTEPFDDEVTGQWSRAGDFDEEATGQWSRAGSDFDEEATGQWSRAGSDFEDEVTEVGTRTGRDVGEQGPTGSLTPPRDFPAPGTVLAQGDNYDIVHSVYIDAARRGSPYGIEAGLYRRAKPDGSYEYIAIQGQQGGVRGPGDGWETVAHFHPGAADEPGFHNPAPQDLNATMDDLMKRGLDNQEELVEMVHSEAPDGSIVAVEFGIDPKRMDAPFFVRTQDSGERIHFVSLYPDDIRTAVYQANALPDSDERMRALIQVFSQLDSEKYYAGWWANQFSPAMMSQPTP